MLKYFRRKSGTVYDNFICRDSKNSLEYIESKDLKKIIAIHASVYIWSATNQPKCVNKTLSIQHMLFTDRLISLPRFEYEDFLC